MPDGKLLYYMREMAPDRHIMNVGECLACWADNDSVKTTRVSAEDLLRQYLYTLESPGIEPAEMLTALRKFLGAASTLD